MFTPNIFVLRKTLKYKVRMYSLFIIQRYYWCRNEMKTSTATSIDGELERGWVENAQHFLFLRAFSCINDGT